jgi:opacity protein-like surface antigen
LSSGLKTGLLIGKGAAMKKLLLATTALIALAGGSAVAADMTPAYKTPPPPLPAYSWTGCYVGAGGGYGIWNQENTTFIDGPPRTLNGVTQTSGGRGWFGTAQVGCDYQFGSTWVVGAFADYDFGSIKGIYNTPNQPMQGGEKESSAWAVGGRIGWTPFDRLLTFFSAGYTQARFDQINLFNTAPPAATLGLNIAAHTYSGWFLGSGYEYAVGWLPGLTWKTEYRFAEYQTDTNTIRVTATGLPSGFSVDSQKWVNTIRSELVYRFGGWR